MQICPDFSTRGSFQPSGDIRRRRAPQVDYGDRGYDCPSNTSNLRIKANPSGTSLGHSAFGSEIVSGAELEARPFHSDSFRVLSDATSLDPGRGSSPLTGTRGAIGGLLGGGTFEQRTLGNRGGVTTRPRQEEDAPVPSHPKTSDCRPQSVQAHRSGPGRRQSHLRRRCNVSPSAFATMTVRHAGNLAE